MFDNVKFFLPRIMEPFEKQESLNIYNIDFQPKVNTRSGSFYYAGYYRNLRFSIYQTGIYVSNSLSAYFYGHNANDINYEQVCSVINDICSVLTCSRNDLIVIAYEFGFTIPVEIKPQMVLQRLVSYRNKLPKLEHREGKLTSAKFYCIDSTIKAYDKALVEKLKGRINLKGNLLRVEHQLEKRFFQKYIYTADDLVKRENIQKVFDTFLKYWHIVRKTPIIDHSKFEKNELQRLYALTNPLYIEDSKFYKGKEAIKKEIQRFRKELETKGDYSMFDNITNSITEKFRKLMDNENVPVFPPLLLCENWGHLVEE